MLTGIIRVSFEANADANNAARRALTGTQVKGQPEKPFKKDGTQVFVCSGADDKEVADALKKLADVIVDNSTTLDFFSVSMTKPQQ